MPKSTEPYYARKLPQPQPLDWEDNEMSGYHYNPNESARQESHFNHSQQFPRYSGETENSFAPYATALGQTMLSQEPVYGEMQGMLNSDHRLHHEVHLVPQQQQWPTSLYPSDYRSDTHRNDNDMAFPAYSMSPAFGLEASNGPATTFLSPPPETMQARSTRSPSFASNGSSRSCFSDASGGASFSGSEMANWGYKNQDGSWSCSHPGCTSRSTFNRGCDLRKHYRRHTKTLFCRQDGCSQATEGGFSSKKDRARHEAKHNPNIYCEWDGCDRLFSRVDNMKDHVRRVHKRKAAH